MKLWWQNYSDQKPNFVKIFNKKGDSNKRLKNSEWLEHNAWCYHYDYLCRQELYDRVISDHSHYLLKFKYYDPTGVYLPVLLNREQPTKVNLTDSDLKSFANHAKLDMSADAEPFLVKTSINDSPKYFSDMYYYNKPTVMI